MNDVRDILDIGDDTLGFTPAAPKKAIRKSEPFKRPEGMHRELYALLCADGGKTLELAPLLPTDTPGGYKQKMNLSAKQARKWKWTPFTNPGRKDGAVFFHWRRHGEENKEYPFAKFNKDVPIVQYSESEYSHHLEKEGWTKEETDHLFNLARRFDVRFPIMHDRYKTYGEKTFPDRSIEDLKERYYQVSGVLKKLRAEPGHESKQYVYDGDHERKRKEQLNKLWNRTPEQMEEEDFLRTELKRIEARKREREKKTQDLQKLITAADGGSSSSQVDTGKRSDATKRGSTSGNPKRKSGKTSMGAKGSLFPSPESSTFYGLKWPDFKNPGITTRSGRMKLPVGVGQKKAKVVESMLREIGCDPHPFQNEEITLQFNELRSDIVLHYELKSILGTCEMEIQSLKHQYEAMKPGYTLDVPRDLEPSTSSFMSMDIRIDPPITESTPVESLPTPTRKRKAALEQGNILKKLKNKM